METLYRQGRVKAIGVSNFDIAHLESLLKSPECTIKPMVNQIELHPFLPQPKLLAFCKQHQIIVAAYSPLGSGKAHPSLLQNETIAAVARREGLTPAQVLIAWVLTKESAVIPRTHRPERLSENFCKDIQLSKESVRDIDAIAIRHRYVDPVSAFGWNCFEEE